MKRIKVALLLICSLFVISAFAKTSAVSQLSALLNRYTTYQANFKQTTYSQEGHATQKSSGRVMMMRPGKFRWETKKPLQQIVIANGRTLWIYDVALEQATKQTLSRKKGVVDPAMLLTGKVSAIMQRFTVTRLTRRDSGFWFQLKPRKKNAPFQLVQMQFKRARLTQIRIKNNLGQTSIFTFTNIRLNRRLNPNLFYFKAPRGVDVLQS